MRRELVNHYMSNALFLRSQLALDHRVLSSISAVPSLHVLRNILVTALQAYLQKKIREIQRLINIYSGSGIRGDGNWDIATRIFAPRSQPPSTVLLAWLTNDGYLYQPPTAHQREDIKTINQQLDPVMTRAYDDRIEASLSVAESAMCFHAADSHRKHRFR